MMGARSHCAACGWPLDGLRCSACGGDRVPLPLQDGGGHFARRDVDEPGLEKAGDALQARDWVKVVALLVGAERASARPVARPDGTGWVLLARGTAVFVTVDAGSGRVTVEAPVGRLPQTRRVPALRAALELGDADGTLLRPCLRGDVLVLRFAGRVPALPPATLRWILRDAVDRAERFADALALRFDARPPWPDEARTPTWDALGQPRALPTLAAPSRQRDLAEGEEEELLTLPPRPRDVPAPERDGAGAPGFAPSPPSSRPAREAEPSPVPGSSPWPASSPVESDLPPILAPSLVRGQPRSRDPESSPAPHVVARVAMPEIDLGDAPAGPPSSRVEAPPKDSVPEPPTVAADRLCALLRTAQALATQLGADHRVGSLLLVVRAAAFRAIHRFGEDVPDAVANLYRSTVGAAGEALAPGSAQRRAPGVEAIVIEPALLTIDRILLLRARVPKERPLTVEPMTSVEEARGFLARYRDEIERAPGDPAVRHFLAAGALAEFLVRAKLPAPMEGRLREILAHAEHEGPRARAVALLMTTLGRIIGS
jgi:hypothetical protein